MPTQSDTRKGLVSSLPEIGFSFWPLLGVSQLLLEAGSSLRANSLRTALRWHSRYRERIRVPDYTNSTNPEHCLPLDFLSREVINALIIKLHEVEFLLLAAKTTLSDAPSSWRGWLSTASWSGPELPLPRQQREARQGHHRAPSRLPQRYAVLCLGKQPFSVWGVSFSGGATPWLTCLLLAPGFSSSLPSVKTWPSFSFINQKKS